MQKLERLLNLITALLNTRQPLSAEQLKQKLGSGAYSDNLVAFRRTFERDKAELRSLGIPLEVVQDRSVDPPVEAYIVDQKKYAGDLKLEQDELAALQLANARVNVQGGTTHILAKLDDDSDPMQTGGRDSVGMIPIERALGPLMDAAAKRLAVSFTHRGQRRKLEPWQVTFHRGRWYVTGWDRDREEERRFRVDRITGTVKHLGEATHPVGKPTAPGEKKPWQFGSGEPIIARVHVDADQAAWACYNAGVEGDVQPDGSAILTLEVNEVRAFRSFVLGFRHHAEILEPEWLRDDLVDWLEGLI